MNSKDHADQIALFRYGIIAPVLHESTQSQSRYFKEMAHETYDVPRSGHKTFNRKTFKSWLHDYRRAGFDGLKPKTRSDKGQPRIIDDHLSFIGVFIVPCYKLIILVRHGLIRLYSFTKAAFYLVFVYLNS